VYYLLYADGFEKSSKVAIDPEEPSLGRIRADSVAPPHSTTSLTRCISRVEKIPALIYADLFPDSSCDTPLIEGPISILCTDGTGMSPNDPMAIVLADVQMTTPSIPDGRYVIKNRAREVYWSAGYGSIQTVFFYNTARTKENAKSLTPMQMNELS
jgi:hypothetical protein